MNDLCIPLPRFGEHQVADVEVTINGKKKRYHYRVEAFPWEPAEQPEGNINEIALTELKIIQLKSLINKYDEGWELIQIYNPPAESKFIHVLFRQKKTV
jgi:hypothetical protein